MNQIQQTIEDSVKETSDLIWNQNGKHTHSELDEILRISQHKLLEAIVGEIERMKSEVVDQIDNNFRVEWVSKETIISLLQASIKK